MIRTIKGIAFRFFQRNKFIALSSIISILLSVCLIITMAVFATNAKKTLEDEVKKLYGDMDLSVGYNIEQNKNINKVLLNNIEKINMVQKTSGVLVSHLKLDKIQAEIYTVGVENDYLSKSRYHFNKSLDSNNVIMNKGLAEALDLKVGQSLMIQDRSFTLIEVIEDLNAKGLTPDMLIITRSTVQELLFKKTGEQTEATYVLIKAKKDSDPISLANEIKMFDTDLRIDVAEEDDFLRSNIDSLTIFIIILSFLIITVTALLIISNFELYLYKYKYEFSIMRSIGATTKQMSKIIMIQSSLITIIGTLGGFLLSILCHQYLNIWLEELFSFAIPSAEFNYGIAIPIALISGILIQSFMLIPIYKSSKILPLKIIQQNEKIDFSYKKIRRNFGYGLFLISLLFICLGKVMPKTQTTGVVCLLIAAVLLLIGIYMLFPIYISSILTSILPIIRLFSGNVSFVAIKNLIPQVRKNTFVILTISAMMIIAVFGSVMLKTIQQNEVKYLKEQFPTTIVVKSRLGFDTMIDPAEIQRKIKKIGSVKNVSTSSTTAPAEIKGDNGFQLLNYSLANLKDMEKQGIIHLGVTDSNNMIVVSDKFLKEHDLKIGDEVVLGLYSEREQKVKTIDTMKIGASLENISGTDAYLDWNNTQFNNEFTKFNKMFITSIDQEKTIAELENIKKQYPELQINTFKQSLDKSTEMFYQRWAIFIVVMLVLLLCVMMGVFNTIANNIYSKRKEFAILRSISIDNKGLRKVILTQVNLYIFIGLVLGVIAGILMTLVVSLIDPGEISFNYLFILGIAASMLVMGNVVFIPISIKLARQKISLELTKDNT
ncbi:putative ABC transport system permease protein [Peribacillus simplex]